MKGLKMKNRSIAKRIFVWIAFMPAMVYAQPGEGLGTEEITVTREYDPSLSDVFKIGLRPTVEDTTTDIPVADYEIPSVQIDLDYSPEAIPAARIARVRKEELYKNYLVLGLGNYLTPHFEYSLTNTRSVNYNTGLYFRHHSSSGRIADYAYSGFQDNDLKLYGERYYRGITLTGDFYWEHDRVHYYHDLMPTDTDRDSIRQDMNTIGFNVGLKNPNQPEKNLFEHANLGYYHFFDRYDARENHITFDAKLSKNIGDEMFNLEIGTDYNNLTMPSDTNNVLTFNLRPTIVSNFGKLDFTLGLGFASVTQLEEQGQTTSFNMFPVVDVTYRIVDQVLIAYAGVDGGVEGTNLRSLVARNPFINTDLAFNNRQGLLQTVEAFKIYAGMKGTLSSKASFNFSADYSRFRDHAFFFATPINTVPDSNKIHVVYDNANVFRLKGEVLYQSTEKLALGVSALYNIYSTSILGNAWHIPNSRITLSAKYNLGEKIIVDAQAFIVGARDVLAADLGDFQQTLDPFVDINLGIEYRYSELLSAYVKVNNLTASQYDLWLGYRAQRFNIHFGFTYRF